MCEVLLVFVAVAAVIVYRIIMTIDYCVITTPVGCLILTSVISAVLNAAAILILGKVSPAVKVTTRSIKVIPRSLVTLLNTVIHSFIKTVKTVDKLQLRTIYGDTNKRP